MTDAPAAVALAGWLARIEGLHPIGMDLGLARVGAVADRLDLRRPAPRLTVVAGTNGKGSCCHLLEAALRAAGHRVGTTISPHLRTFNERVRIDGVAVDDATLVAAFEAIETARGATTLTYFEFATLAALLCFRRAGVAHAVIEVGLGGRLDASNLVDTDVAVVTSIGLDHTEWLGPDLDSIAREKVAIMRPGRPLVYGDEPVRPAALAAEREGAQLFLRGRDFTVDSAADGSLAVRSDGPGGTCRVGLPAAVLGADAVAVTVQALRCLGVDPDRPAVRAALATTAVPGRFEQRTHGHARLVLDVGHNEPAGRFLAARLRAAGIRIDRAVIGMLADKDAAGTLAALAPLVAHWELADLPGARGRAARALAAALPAGASARCWPSVGEALAAALATGAARVLVAGSHLTVAAALDWLDEHDRDAA